MNKDVETHLNIKEPYNPITLLKTWVHEAYAHSAIKEANAAVLSTFSLDQKISSRVVLIKEITKEGLTFYTNQTSQKGQHLNHNDQCTLHFYWDPLFRQASIQGKASPMSREQTISYWKTRSIESQLSQWISKQSSPVRDRNILLEEVQKARSQFKNKTIPCPEHWLGYFIQVEQIEFWVGREHRLHDRFLFTQKESQWVVRRLYP